MTATDTRVLQRLAKINEMERECIQYVLGGGFLQFSSFSYSMHQITELMTVLVQHLEA